MHTQQNIQLWRRIVVSLNIELFILVKLISMTFTTANSADHDAIIVF